MEKMSPTVSHQKSCFIQCYPKEVFNSGKTSKDRSIPGQKQNKVCFAGMRFGFY
jgi:hypothetical protein